MRIRLDAMARRHMREIHAYSRERWGDDRADAYSRTLSAKFEAIAARRTSSRQIPAVLGTDGYFCACESHFVYWRRLGDDAIAIVAILHQSMHQDAKVRAAFFESP